MKWSVGIITAPREKGFYLTKTLDSIYNAGWDDVTLFAEPNSPIPKDFKGRTVQRDKVYGDWSNWIIGLFDLFINNPKTDYFLMFEDDVIMCKNTRKYLEYQLQFLPNFAYLNFYTIERYHRTGINGFHNEERGWDTWTTQTVVIKFKNIIKLFSDEDVLRHRLDTTGTEHDNTSKDCILGKWAKKINLPVFYHSPSIAEHIGVKSTLEWAKKFEYTNEKYPQSKDFLGENFDISSWNHKVSRCDERSVEKSSNKVLL